jgi:hypothetical protein
MCDRAAFGATQTRERIVHHGHYRFETDPARNFLRVELDGVWDESLTAAFVVDLERTIRGMIGAGAIYGEFRTIVDMSRKNILPQNATAEFAKIMRPDSPSRRIALVVSGTLHRLQAKRLSTMDKYRIFDRDDDALAWLWADDA